MYNVNMDTHLFKVNLQVFSILFQYCEEISQLSFQDNLIICCNKTQMLFKTYKISNLDHLFCLVISP